MNTQSKCLLWAVLLLLVSPTVGFGSDHEIAYYGRLKGQRPDTASRIWLMERDGANPVYVYETCGWSYPRWSPDGGSLVILQNGYRDVEGYGGVLRLDLTEPPTEPLARCPEYFPPKIVDLHGTVAAEIGSPFEYLDGATYSSIYLAEWSPRGDEIGLLIEGWDPDPDLAFTGDWNNAILAADPNDLCDPDCQAVSPIYHAFDQYIGEFDWSPDGEQLVILYGVLQDGVEISRELAIIDRLSGLVSMGPWTVEQVTRPGAHDMDHLAWAPVNPDPARFIGPVIAFDASVPVGRNKEDTRVHLVDLGANPPVVEEVVNGWKAAWSPDSQHLALEIYQENPQVYDFATDTATDLGDFWFAWSPDWKPVSTAECSNNACESGENSCNCPEDCGEPPFTETLCTDLADNDCDTDVDCDDVDCSGDPVCQAPYCGDGFCDPDEDECTCPGDCGTPLSSEAGLCDDGFDNDCDLNADCSDTDCFEDPVCSATCGAKDDRCDTGADCCSGLCHPVKNVCK